MALCPACEQENADEAQTCSACGTPLVMRCPSCDTINVRTRSACHRCHAPLRSASAAGPDDPSAGPNTEPAVVLTLLSDALDGREPAYWRDLGPVPAPPSAAAPWLAGTDPTALDWPSLDTAATPEAPRGSAAGGPTSAMRSPVAQPRTVAPGTTSPGAPTRHQLAKAERRAKVRQRQLRTQRDQAAPTATPPVDVLLLEPDAGSRVAICGVLEEFGFRTHAVVDADEAVAMSQQRRYAAVLLGIGAPEQDTASLCHQLRRMPAFGATPVFAIGDPGRHADRVRMQLAGAQDTLMRPVTRGALAHTLNLHGVVLPRDPRVGGPPPA